MVSSVLMVRVYRCFAPLRWLFLILSHVVCVYVYTLLKLTVEHLHLSHILALSLFDQT